MAQGIARLPATGALRAFEAAARCGSFTAAARELNQTQGAISHQIRELEQRLGGPLFERRARGIALSARGEAYLPYARDALARLRAGSMALARIDQQQVLTVSMSPNFAARWLVPRLGAFLSAHPGLDLRISAATEHVSFEDDGIDLAIRHGEGRWPSLHVTRLCAEDVFPVCSTAFISRFPAASSIADLPRLTLLHDRERSSWREWLARFQVDIDGSALTSGPVFSQASLAIDAAVAGQGMALARTALVSLDLAARRLVRPFAESVPAPFAYWIVCPPPRAGRLPVQRFTRWLLEEAATDLRCMDATHRAR